MAMNIKGKSGKELIREYVSRFGKDAICAFSCGKDSICTALSLLDQCNVVPVHYYIVPDLPMIEESLHYFETKLFGRKILRYPDQRFYDWLDTGTYQTITNLEIVDAAYPRLPNPLHRGGGVTKYREQRRQWIVEQEELNPLALIAVGVTARDSPQRWMSFQKHGQIRPSSGAFYPIWDYDRAKIIDTVERSGLKLPIDYHLFGRTFDGLSVEYLVPIKRYRPQDWQVILDWFPLAEVEVWKYEKTYGPYNR